MLVQAGSARHEDRRPSVLPSTPACRPRSGAPKFPIAQQELGNGVDLFFRHQPRGVPTIRELCRVDEPIFGGNAARLHLPRHE